MPFSKYRSTLNTAVSYFGFSACKAVPIAPTLSTPKGIEHTFDAYLKSFTQSRFQDWNPILLFLCPGTVSSFLLSFNSLVLSLVNWLTGWNSAFKLSVQGYPFCTIHQESLSLSRQNYCIKTYMPIQLRDSKFLSSLSSPPHYVEGGVSTEVER